MFVASPSQKSTVPTVGAEWTREHRAALERAEGRQRPGASGG